MEYKQQISNSFSEGLSKLGFQEDESLYFINQNQFPDEPQILFLIETTKNFGANAVYVRKQLNGSYKPQVYLFDFTERNFVDESENEIANIQKIIWSSGEAPLACIFYKTEIKILDCTKHITKDYKPEYLVRSLNLTDKAHKLYNEQFAIKVKTGLFWEEEDLKSRFRFQNSAYDKLIENIRFVINRLTVELESIPKEITNKIIIQSILIKYLEERIDENGNKLLSEKYFQKYNNASTFSDVLKLGKFGELLTDLNKDFNGNVFKWDDSELKQLNSLDLKIVSDLLATDKTDLGSSQLEIGFPDWRYFEFKFIPVELISRLYEEFLGENKQQNGLFYTPSHLAKLLVDESIPLNQYQHYNLNNFSVLDPACGSGIFLVIVFKRLVQIWRLQNKLKHPDIEDLKPLLKNIYGVDKEEQAIRLACFSLSLALCNELNPVKIINELKFDDLSEENLIHSDFFNCPSIKWKKFDLIIGNPPFVRGAISGYTNIWETVNHKVKIPQGQIALKFLTETLSNLKDKGLVCLIIKSSGLIYNSTSREFKKALFSSYNIIQILDFTALARNKSLWDNGADVASAAIFIKNELPDVKKNILHLTFRRTKATKERIVFEIDEYDLHFITRQTAIENEFIWKNNLLGGGRIKNLVQKAQNYLTLQEILDKNECLSGEGYIVGSNGKLDYKYVYNLPSLPTEAINDRNIDYEQLFLIDKNTKFVKIPEEIFFTAPNIILWENIGEDRIPVFFNQKSFSFKDKLISIVTKNSDKTILKDIVDSFQEHSNFYRFYIFATSSQLLINLNTAILKKDYMQLRFLSKNESNDFFTHSDKQIISDVNVYFQDFLRHGEKSIALKPIPAHKFKDVIGRYGNEFSNSLNMIYEDNSKKFKLTNVIELRNSFIAAIFKYDSENVETYYGKDLSEIDIEELSNTKISFQLSVKRVIKLYPRKDTIIFIKPNQIRYWIPLTAYRDADKCFSDFSNQINI
ncbi:type I restriction-modification system DNA methylase subunit [Breznakibacter xylanolyticus]|uniref:site-specific DNA-methyltransferase (adenine-specific) n=1 Tax=Breznakibacter xylanolyticus TaxID=990 RepID=A0A2W7NH65_9BACT|nr:N-6 DNA methylase [Breznakibacter xylanolyticus]PZX10612.1 type I restriction-modification system DNA methylase subunit [Breznakibacter xylanolyticus]